MLTCDRYGYNTVNYNGVVRGATCSLLAYDMRSLRFQSQF
jgi:hypothetical protein